MHRLAIAIVWLAASWIGVAGGAPIFNAAAGACPSDPAACTENNGNVFVQLFNPFYIDPGNDTTGAYTNLFKRAFETWNASLSPFRRWSIAGLSLNNTATLTIDTYRAYVGEEDNCDPKQCGGAEIEIHYSRGNILNPEPITDEANIGEFSAIWSQSILTSFKNPGSLPGNPFLDGKSVAAGAMLSPPAYPFQYEESMFYDKSARDKDAIWLGQAFLVQANYTNRVLIVYGGVGWGFYVQGAPGRPVAAPVPEPSPGLLFAGGVLVMLIGKLLNLRGLLTGP
jgi:hypothetical protein